MSIFPSSDLGPTHGLMLALVAWILSCLFFTSAASAQTVTQDYGKARVLFERGDTTSAARILLKIVRRYPDHQPSNLLLGQAFYRLNDPAKAARYFSRVPIDLLNADGAFEYGAAMFAAERCDRSIKAFAKVADGSEFKDVAHFYTGVCFMRQKQWHKAGLFLRRAKKIPRNLAASRRKLLRTLAEREREEQMGSGPAGVSPYFVPVLPPQPYVYGPSQPSGAAESPDAAKKKAPPPPPKVGFSVAVTPAFTSTSVSQRDDNFGRKTTLLEGSTLEETVGLALRYDGKPRESEGQSAFTLNIDAGRYSTKINGESTAYKSFDDDPTSVFTEIKTVNPTSVQTSSDGVTLRVLDAGEMYDYRFTPGIFLPVGETIDLDLKFAYYDKYPGMNSANRGGTRSPSGRLVLEFGSLTTELNVVATEIHAASKLVQNDVTAGGKLIKNFETVVARLSVVHVDSTVPDEIPKVVPQTNNTVETGAVKNWEAFSLSGTLRHTMLEPQPGETLAGALTTTRGEVSGKVSLAIGSVTATGFMAKLADYRAKNLDHPIDANDTGKPVKVDAVASGTQTGGTIALKVSPLPWLWGTFGYTVQKSAFEIEDELLGARFQAATPELRTIFTYAFGVSKSF